MKISQRERVLLLFAGLLFIVILPFFVFVKPMIENSREKFKQLSDISDQAVMMSIEINTIDAIKAEHEIVTKELEGYRRDIPAKEKSYNIHYQLTEMCARAGVTVESLNIGDYVVVTREVKDETTGSVTIEKTPIYEAMVTLKVKGSLAQILDMTQEIDDKGKYLILTDFTVSDMNIDPVLTGSFGIKFYAADATVGTDIK